MDKRLLRVDLTINGRVNSYDTLAIESNGAKFCNSIANEGIIKITNLDRTTRDWILSATTPYQLNPSTAKIELYAGRESTGYASVFVADIFRSTITQPPDIGLTIICMTGFSEQGNIVSVSNGASTKLSTIVQSAANKMGLQLVNQATDKTVANYHYSGSAFGQIEAIGAIGGIDAYIDDNKLVVKNLNQALTGSTKLISQKTGMIGIPEVTAFGIRVKFLWDADTKIGSAITVHSELNPTANGTYTIYKLEWHLANRATQFYYIAEAVRPGI